MGRNPVSRNCQSNYTLYAKITQKAGSTQPLDSARAIPLVKAQRSRNSTLKNAGAAGCTALGSTVARFAPPLQPPHPALRPAPAENGPWSEHGGHLQLVKLVQSGQVAFVGRRCPRAVASRPLAAARSRHTSTVGVQASDQPQTHFDARFGQT